MPDSVEEPIKLPNIITDDWYNKEVEKVKKSEILANRADAAKKRLAAGISPLGQTNTGPSITLPRGYESEIAANPFVNTTEYQNQYGGTKPLAAGQAPINLPSSFAQHRDKIEKDVEESIFKKLGISPNQLTSEGLNLISNPTGFLTNNLSKVLGELGPEALIAVLGAQFIAQLAQQIFKMYTDQYGAGGWFDTRKLVLDQTKEVAPLDTIQNIANGTVYFTDDAGQRLKQRAPENSNTRLLRDGHARYLQLHIGE